MVCDIEFIPRDVIGLQKKNPTATRVFTGIVEFGIFLETTEQNEHFRTTVGKLGMFLSYHSRVDFFGRDLKNIPPGSNRSRKVIEGRDRFDPNGMLLESRPKIYPIVVR